MGWEVTFSLKAQMEQRGEKAELSLPLSPLEWMPIFSLPWTSELLVLGWQRVAMWWHVSYP